MTSLPSTTTGGEVERLVHRLESRFGSALDAVLLYGSCFHRGDYTDGLVDFYVLVDSYQNAYPGRVLRVGNALLPPNVFYLEDLDRAPPLRAKYAVLSTADFEEACASWFHPYVWARFAQPSGLVHTRNDAVARRVGRAVDRAVIRFLSETVPLLADAGDVDARTLWREGLDRSYASELRPERGRSTFLTRIHGNKLESRTARAAASVPGLVPLDDGRYRVEASRAERRRAERRWHLRRWQGGVLSLLRLAKAAFTFEGGLEYAAWKLERHAGQDLSVPSGLAKRPLLRSGALLFHLLRRRNSR